jgi:DNA-binding protein Fis
MTTDRRFLLRCLIKELILDEKMKLHDFKKEILQSVRELYGPNKSRMARALGLTVRTIRHWINDLEW